MDNWAEIIEEIKLHISAQNLTQRELAARMNIHESALNRMLNGVHRPKIEQFLKLLKALDLTIKLK